MASGRARHSAWSWVEGAVDQSGEHIELRHGDVHTSEPETWTPVARLGPPHGSVFPVEWLRPETPIADEILADVRRELNFYLVELGEDDPWAYAKYHCSTASNVYSIVHWAYWPEGSGGDGSARHATKQQGPGESRNSSLTRVRPVFQQLLGRDPSGDSWLGPLLQLLPSPSAKRLASAPGLLLPDVTRRRAYFDRVVGPVELEACFERSVPPPASLLAWLIENSDRLNWAGRASSLEGQSATIDNRKALRDAATRSDAASRALECLRRDGAIRSRRKWWAFEGFTEVDCCLETDRLVLLIEGKRNESLAGSTHWYTGRNQLHRNLEAARDLAGGREFGVIIAAEVCVGAEALGDTALALPHLSPADRSALMDHYWGCVMWRDLCAAVGVDFDGLPETVARVRRDSRP